MTIGGPLFSLYWMGYLPCCQKEEDKSAREALNHLNLVGARIMWHQSKNRLSLGNVKQAAFSFFGKKASSPGSDSGRGNGKIVKAQFKLFDGEENIPEIQIAPRRILEEIDDGDGFGDESDMDFSNEDSSPGKSKKNDKKKKAKEQQLNIPLKRIHTVVPLEQDLIVLNLLEPDGKATKEWARFALEAQDQGTRNMFVHNLQVLMEWDRQRRTNCGELEYDETSAASTIKARAQKAAHFARRELELKQTRKSREDRKAKYVQESGGLKYTAIAMAKNAGAS